MQKFSFAVIITFLTLYLQSSTTVWVAYFALQEEIIKYCENKSNAACAGKCQIQKIESQVESQKQSDTSVQVNIPHISEFLPKTFSIPLLIHTSLLSFPICSDLFFPSGYENTVFRPPISA